MDPEFIRELFAPFGPVTIKRMFGGAGIWSAGLMFALVFDGAIFLKVDETSIPDFAREGSKPFVYTRAKSGMLVSSTLRKMAPSKTRANISPADQMPAPPNMRFTVTGPNGANSSRMNSGSKRITH